MVLEFITYIFYILCISAWHNLEKYIPIFNIMHRLKYLKHIIVGKAHMWICATKLCLFLNKQLILWVWLKSQKYISNTRLAMSRILVPRTHGNGTAFLIRLVDSWSWLEPARTEAVQPPPLHAVCNGHWVPHVGGLSLSKHTTHPIPAFLCVGLSFLHPPVASVRSVRKPCRVWWMSIPEKHPCVFPPAVALPLSDLSVREGLFCACFLSGQQKHVKKKTTLTVLLMRYLRSQTLTKNLL